MFVSVPIDFLDFFRRNPIGALQNHAGVSVTPQEKLLQVHYHFLISAYDFNLKHPFIQDEVELSTGDSLALKDYFFPDMIVDRKKPHGIHVDQSVSHDYTGFSMVRYDGEVMESGAPRRKYTQVFSIRIVPPRPPHQIDIAKVYDFIFYLVFDLGVNVVRVTYDQYQCLKGDSLVPTLEGEKKLEDIKIGDIVWTESGPNKVKSIFVYRDVPTVRIITNSGLKLEGTANHRIRGAVVERLTNSELSCRDFCFVWRELGEFRVGDVVKVAEWVFGQKYKDIAFDVIKSIEYGVGAVFDLEVENDASYMVNGFVSHNSTASQQALRKRGINANYRSLDKDDSAYLLWLGLLTTHSVRMYNYPPLEQEAVDAIHYREKRKVDHPPKGRIDVLQSFVGALANVAEEDIYVQVDPSLYVDSLDNKPEFSFLEVPCKVVDIESAIEEARSKKLDEEYMKVRF